MIKNSHRLRNNPQSSNKNKKAPSLSVFDFIKRAAETIQVKSQTALHKINAKIIQDPAVYILPLENRKKMHSHAKSPQVEQKSLGKDKAADSLSRSKPKLSQKQAQKLSQLMKKRHELMTRLRKIDHELHNPSMLPVTFQSNSNSSFVTDHERVLSHKVSDSRVNFRQSKAYNVSQHEKTMEMLTRLNNQKIRRQEKIVSDMKRKQENEIKKLQQMQRNQSKLNISRQQRNMKLLRAINKKQTSKLMDTQQAQQTSNNHPQKQYSSPNQFDKLSQNIQIGSEQRLPTEEYSASFHENNQ